MCTCMNDMFFYASAALLYPELWRLNPRHYGSLSKAGAMNGLARPLAAEFIGTFALIFVGAGAGTVLGGGQIPGIALAHGLTIMVFACAFGDISGCHINPAVTVGLASAGVFPMRRVAPYVAAQLSGAIVAGYSLLG